MFPRQKPVPLVQPGGVQPYHGATPQHPGPDLMAMLAGRDAQGGNPMDAWRAMQRQARVGQQQQVALSLLQRLAR